MREGPMDATNWNEDTREPRAQKWACVVRWRAGGKGLQPQYLACCLSDWLVGICGPRSLAEQVKEELKDFLRESLKLTLSEDKTRITHARKEQAQFLGTQLGIGREGVPRIVTTTNGSGKPIKRRSTGSETVMTAPMSKLIKKLHTKGFCTRAAQPCTKRGWIHFDADQIVALYNGINQGLQNYYRFADNFNQFTQIQYILRFSLAKTLAAKYKCSVKQVFRKFGTSLTITVKAKDGKRDRHITFFLNKDWEKRRNGFQIHDTNIELLQWSIKMRTRSKLGKPCCICNASEPVEMHHVRHIRKMGGKKPVGFNRILRAMNRKQIPVCTTCHQKIHCGDYDGIRLSDLAYNPYPPVKRKRSRESRMR